jgi:hypothetical protein
MLVSCWACCSALIMEATCSSETWVDFLRTTRRCITEDRALHVIHSSHEGTAAIWNAEHLSGRVNQESCSCEVFQIRTTCSDNRSVSIIHIVHENILLYLNSFVKCVPGLHVDHYLDSTSISWLDRGSIPSRNKRLFSAPQCQVRLCGPPCLLSNGYRALFLRS